MMQPKINCQQIHLYKDEFSSSKSPGSAGASSAQTSSTTAPASNPNSITDTPSQACRIHLYKDEFSSILPS
uniref:Uncharacterized protein n=1 Tax=Tanacetum cinerariifolium TaxID=118510 RepID=A0A6L2MK11_TANCI|nr:hypothetical protein [Tanacetum cinerariifolium]